MSIKTMNTTPARRQMTVSGTTVLTSTQSREKPD